MNNPFRSPAWRAACLSALMVLVAGCTKKLPGLPTTYPVTGKVTVAGDKSSEGLVIGFKCLETESYNGSARVKPDGTYSAGAFPTAAGLVPGEYEIWLEQSAAVAGVLADKYKKTETSGLRLTVKAEENKFDIPLD